MVESMGTPPLERTLMEEKKESMEKALMEEKKESMERALKEEKRPEDLMRSTDGLHCSALSKMETISCCIVFHQLL